MASELEQYISDNSLRLFGVSNKTIIDYVIASGTCSSWVACITTPLKDYTLATYSRCTRIHQRGLLKSA
ncbi:hypothetical protein BDN71DRAFT_742292 [Pleurotus eryngii]|uniref:Uncharacterized protein n=1 Tax=Pleurotus eryngii TaxID=5323 RepID=A0A9P6A0Q6_PLEER|nr:hypothetical protein BDN71DRAFT_742292 [Pleurotus eryngii]